MECTLTGGIDDERIGYTAAGTGADDTRYRYGILEEVENKYREVYTFTF